MTGGKRPDGVPRWNMLSHFGVLLPAPYEPHGVPVRLVPAGRELRGLPELVRLTPDAEEMLTDYVRLGGTTGAGRAPPQLRGSVRSAQTFWDDWRKLLPDDTPVRKLADIDVAAIQEWVRENKGKSRSKSRSRSRRSGSSSSEALPRQAFAFVDGQKQQVSPYAVERPGVFVGRNASAALTGRIRRRLMAADVTLNLGLGVEAPPPSDAWADIVHNRYADWIAKWKDPVTGKTHYARLAASAPSEQEGFVTKYDLARRMCALLPRFRSLYRRLLASGSPRERQLGACLWLIEQLGVRVGRSGNDAAHGATTILARHVSFPAAAPATSFRLDFPGKDGVQYVRTVHAPPSVASAFREAAARKPQGHRLLDRVSADSVNAAIARVLGGASAKVLRTCRACTLFEETLLEVEGCYGGHRGRAIAHDAARLALLLAYVRTAILCNHRARCDETSELDASALEPQVVAAMAAAAARKAPGAVARQLIARVVRPGCLGLYTARTSYVDTRIIAAFCSRNGYPLAAALHSPGRQLPSRFKWAADTPGTFRFCAAAAATTATAAATTGRTRARTGTGTRTGTGKPAAPAPTLAHRPAPVSPVRPLSVSRAAARV